MDSYIMGIIFVIGVIIFAVIIIKIIANHKENKQNERQMAYEAEQYKLRLQYQLQKKTERDNYVNWLKTLEAQKCTFELLKKYTDEKLFKKFLSVFKFLDIVPLNNITMKTKLMKPYIGIKVYNDILIVKYKETGLEDNANIYYSKNKLDNEDVKQIELFFDDNKRTPISKNLRDNVLKRDNFKCRHCGRSAPNVVLHIDHIRPVSKGGSNKLENLQTLCEDCNKGKSNKYTG